MGDWERFKLYARRVRSLSLDEQEEKTSVSREAFDEISRTRVSLNILPNLRQLTWITASVDRMRLSLMFQHENITDFSVNLHRTNTYPITTFFQEVMSCMPNLKVLDLRFAFPARDVEDDLIALLTGLPKLHKIRREQRDEHLVSLEALFPMLFAELNADITRDAYPIRCRSADLIALVSLYLYLVSTIEPNVRCDASLTTILRATDDFKVRWLSLTADPGTDWWRKPSSINSENGPTHPVKLNTTDFHRARVTVSADWTHLHDQGDLFIFVQKVFSNASESKRCWLKTGIEFYHEKPNASIVSSREWWD